MTLKNLKAYQPDAVTITFGENTLTLRAISVSNLHKLFRNQGEFIGREFKSFTNVALLDGGLSAERGVAIVEVMLEQGPPLIASIIATAAGEGDDPEAVAVALGLPLGVTFEALDAIFRLTFAGTSPKRVIDTIVHAIRGANAVTEAEFATALSSRN